MKKEVMYLSENVDEVDLAEHELESEGINRDSIQVYSQDESGLVEHDLPSIPDFEKLDVWRRGWMGAAIGFALAVCFLLLTVIFSWHSELGWPLFGFIALLIFGFCTWEGGFLGIQTTNHRFIRVKEKIEQGAHLMIVKIRPDQEDTLRNIVGKYPSMQQL